MEQKAMVLVIFGLGVMSIMGLMFIENNKNLEIQQEFCEGFGMDHYRAQGDLFDRPKDTCWKISGDTLTEIPIGIRDKEAYFIR